jgi:hypothetical protein
MFACFFTGLWFQGRKHTLSGIPNNHVPVQEGRHYFFVPRGGGPVDGRPRQPITAEQFQAWEENQQTGAILMALSVPCLNADQIAAGVAWRESRVRISDGLCLISRHARLRLFDWCIGSSYGQDRQQFLVIAPTTSRSEDTRCHSPRAPGFSG